MTRKWFIKNNRSKIEILHKSVGIWIKNCNFVANMKRLLFLLAACMAVISLCLGAEPYRDNGIVTVRPTTGGTRVVSLQAVGDNIVRVRASIIPFGPAMEWSDEKPDTDSPQGTMVTYDGAPITTRVNNHDKTK